MWVEKAEANEDRRLSWQTMRRLAIEAGHPEEAADYHTVYCFDVFDISLDMPDGTTLDGSDAWAVMGEVMREERSDGKDIAIYYRLKEDAHERLSRRR